MHFEIRSLTGTEIKPFIEDLARLRIEVFREYPYLYDGSPEYEEKYLKVYSDCETSIVVAVFHEDRMIGASTGLPMEFAAEALKEPFIKKGFSPETFFYFGESVLLKKFRGQGVYGRFFAGREAHAEAVGGFEYATFCAVERPPDHPRKPSDYTPLDRYWEKRGYVKQPDVVAYFPWKDLDEDKESLKPMRFWVKPLI
jgi:hypothetical protein